MKGVSKVWGVVLSAVILLGGAFLPSICAAEDQGKLDSRVKDARLVLMEMQDMPDTSIPRDLLKKCSGIAIFPSVLKAGFGIGGQYGQGVLLNRDAKTGEWSAPMFLSIGGASIGFQIGGQATDMILVIMNERGMDSLSHGNVTLGGDASIAAGPLGRDASIGSDVLIKSGIFSYSRSKGLFAGISLKGAIVGPMKNLNQEYYGEGVTARDILFSGKVAPTEEGKQLIEVLSKY
ncbi:MAG: lipid-binding SYLF domain-containing protein [Candidatus Omnitrophota bacterium]